MFLPAEAVFAEIHSSFPELVQCAQRAGVWLVSPTTMVAVLTTVSAIIRDDAVKQQVLASGTTDFQHVHIPGGPFIAEQPQACRG